MAPSYTLAGLSPREAVADALQRCILGLDNNDRDLFESAIVKDESSSFVIGPNTIQGWNAMSESLSRILRLVTTHFITSVRVDLKDGTDTASLSAHAQAYHIRPDDAFKQEDTSYTSGGLYFIDLVRDVTDGLWKIKKWEVKLLWTTGDREVINV
ncbi:uncharacterized protein A1O9_07488 [Exophiala aquamarina CBS 119918]|uniref:SnoaL-like domain-containing protein n=1 Tax=Exophiala aquamarina CBS 119918 TaxID=1182545 RepID=A0A072P9G2_9EURO|nr:uncharacterized protein A1O9_07488 [Exophiala aquamarina CBS 119918]KEF55908.1 hypothetical protein A1O9_07488 [Exophiala aquamarina CBS 119918]